MISVDYAKKKKKKKLFEQYFMGQQEASPRVKTRAFRECIPSAELKIPSTLHMNRTGIFWEIVMTS